jgi:hypothetical protein
MSKAAKKAEVALYIIASRVKELYNINQQNVPFLN